MADRDRDQAQKRGVPPALIGAVLLALVVVIFVLQNNKEVTVHFLWFTRNMQVWVLLLLTSAIAIGAAELFSLYLRHRRED
ncbi:MAG TPA: LapA family protein [Acidimicrobiales bacterium]|jgi:uncharacterized integral membrane protein